MITGKTVLVRYPTYILNKDKNQIKTYNTTGFGYEDDTKERNFNSYSYYWCEIGYNIINNQI